MPIAYSVTKQIVNGDHVTVQVTQHDPVTGVLRHTPEEMHELFRDMMTVVDERTEDMNMRMLEAYQFQKYLKPEVWQYITQILDVIANKVRPETLIARWQSGIEETAALEALRSNHE